MSVASGIQWCLSITKKQTVYSQATRNKNECNGYTGSPQYFDCTSFVCGYAFKGGWLPKYLIAGNNSFYTGNMGSYLTKYGFKKLPVSTQVQQGDIVVRNFGTSNDHAEVVYTSGGPANSNNYKTIGTGGSSPHSVIVQQSNFGSSPCNELYRPIDAGEGTISDGYGWSLKAFCAMLGSVAHEGIYNPGQIQGGLSYDSPYVGLGLIQWTDPIANHNPLKYLANWQNKNWYDGDLQCEAINNCDDPAWQRAGYTTSLWGWIGVQSPTDFNTFKTSDGDLAQLTRAWYLNVERPPDTDDTFNTRYQTALHWYNILKDTDSSIGNSLSWKYNITNSFSSLTTAEQENNALLMYSIFCGSGHVGSGTIDPDQGYYRRRRSWNIIYQRPLWKRNNT